MAMPDSPAPPWVVGAVLGFFAGAIAMALAWTVSPGSVDDAEADARAGCAAIERAGDFDEADKASFFRWVAGVRIAGLAADQNGDYRPLADALDAALRAQDSKDPGSAEAREAIEKARDACADL
jgi:hypothetical protein